MSFIPVIYVPPPPSRQARELGERIRNTIEEYQRSEPGVSSADVQQALRLAETRSGGGGTTVLAFALGLVAVAGLLVFGYVKRGGSLENWPVAGIVLGAILVLGLGASTVALRR